MTEIISFKRESQRYNLSRMEQETVIVKAADEKEWDLYSCDPAIQRKMKKIGIEPYQKNLSHEPHGCWYKLPPNQITFRKPVKLTEKQRAKMADAARERFGV